MLSQLGVSIRATVRSRANGHARGHKTVALRQATLASSKGLCRRPALDSLLERVNRRDIRDNGCTGSVQDELVTSRLEAAHLQCALDEQRERLQDTRGRPCKLNVVVNGGDKDIGETLMHALEDALKGRCKTKRPKGATLSAASLREKADPPIGAKRCDVGWGAVRSK